MESPFDEIFALAKPYLKTRNNLVHTEIVVRFAELLADREGGNIDIIIPAAILHDVGWSLIPEHLQLSAFGAHATDAELNRTHETGGVTIAKSILNSVSYDTSLSDKILKIIDGHDSNPVATSIEDAAVKDADKLWRYSKEGFITDCNRFELSAEESLVRLRRKIPIWFLTPSGTETAMAELARRENEVAAGLDD